MEIKVSKEERVEQEEMRKVTFASIGFYNLNKKISRWRRNRRSVSIKEVSSQYFSSNYNVRTCASYVIAPML